MISTSTHPAKHDWDKSKTSSEFNARNLLNLFHNKLPSLSLANFATPEECMAMASVLAEIGYDNYLNVHPPIGRIGITQYEAKKMGKDWYFDRAAEENKKQKLAFKQSFNPIERLQSHLKNLLPDYAVNIACENDTNYYAGLVRQINNTALIHADYAPYDAHEWQISKIIGQIAWNVCVKAPESGGECIVYNKPWDMQQDDRYLIPDSYGYNPEMVENCERISINPAVGDAYFFNSRNFHEVKASSSDRITISCFIGLTANKEILIWS